MERTAKRATSGSARRHASYGAFLAHRLSGVALALFLPVHFWVLGVALGGEAGLQSLLELADHPLIVIGEWGLVVLLALHMALGIRILLLELLPWRGLRRSWILLAVGFSTLFAIAFAAAKLV